MMKRTLISLVVMVCLVPLSLRAGLFGWLGKKDGIETPEAVSTNTVKRLHLTLADKAAEKELLQLTAAKRIVFQERKVLMLLIDEKQEDLENLDAELTKTFGIRRDRNYRYDAKAMTIYEETRKAGMVTNATGTVSEPTLIKQLVSESESRKFASLAAAKQITGEDLMVLARLAREKEVASERVENVMKEKFSMSRDRNYWYENATMRLYELVGPSPKGVVQ
ncbi:MAG: hypothetical protein WCI03_07525 [bacterium]|jgi:hypothetical protein